MTIDELKTIAHARMATAKKQLSANGNCEVLFEAWFEDGTSKSLGVPPEKGEIMNSGEAKTHMFGLLRAATKAFNVQAWVFVTNALAGIPTEEGKKHAGELNANFEQLVKKGWIVGRDVIQITAQTLTDVLWLRQFFIRDEKRRKVTYVGPPEEIVIKQEHFHGRQKMWGATDKDADGSWWPPEKTSEGDGGK